MKQFAFSVLALCLTIGSHPAYASNFQQRFVAKCMAGGVTNKACECRYNALNKPRNVDEEKLILAVAAEDDAKVEALIKTANNLRSVTIINSMTRGLFACIKF